MAVRRKLMSELRRTGGSLVTASDQRRYATSLQSATAHGLSTDFEGTGEMKPYSAVPGPRELPLIGNAWRFLPYIGEQLLVGLHTAPAAQLTAVVCMHLHKTLAF
jgi:cytochrome P450 family 49 subfamily A